MAATRRNLFKAATQEKPVEMNKMFLRDVMQAVEERSVSNPRKPSRWYKPSGLNCQRAMWFTRLGYPMDTRPSAYNSIGMADTGTRRHEAIQEVLTWMTENGSDWEYVDVGDYIYKNQQQGKLLNLKVQGKYGAETKLFDEVLLTSFMCDGVILHKPTGRYFLFEFKNQISFKYCPRGEAKKVAVDKEHHKQVTCYCTSLGIDEAFVTYENRDTLELNIPELFKVTPEMKENLVAYLLETEDYVSRGECPPKPENMKCNFCGYKAECRKKG